MHGVRTRQVHSNSYSPHQIFDHESADAKQLIETRVPLPDNSTHCQCMVCICVEEVLLARACMTPQVHYRRDTIHVHVHVDDKSSTLHLT